jgi:5-oxoprolinase (ATP-hydrolysing)
LPGWPTISPARPARAARPRKSPTAFLRIAVENMANAIKHISVQRGYDVTEYTLCCFGGAGGQHACAVADALGMTRVFIHPLAGVLSAYGMGLADVRALRQRAVEASLTAPALSSAAATFDELERAARDEIAAQGIAADRIACTRTLHVKYDGTDTDAGDRRLARTLRRLSPSSSAGTRSNTAS